MTQLALFHYGIVAVFIFAAMTFIILSWVSAPYGRHYRSGWGLDIPNRLGWILMESPAVLFFAFIYFQGSRAYDAVPLALFAVWQCHYIHRTFIFPFRLRDNGKRMPVLIALMGFLFNALNAYVNAYWISHYAQYSLSWFWSVPFIAGVGIFILGFYINLRSDHVLMNLRKPGETGYKIPQGFLYRWICSPNYLGEILEWVGFALAAWSLAGLAFALYTAANLVPRALTHLRWYRKTFNDFPKERRAIIPFIL